MALEILVQVWRVVRWREGAIHQTENTGELRWVEHGDWGPEDLVYVPVAGEDSIRTKK